MGTVVDLGSDTRVREELRAEPVVPARVSRSGDAVGAGPGAGHAEPGTTPGGGDAETQSVLTGEGTGVSLVSPPRPSPLAPSRLSVTGAREGKLRQQRGGQRGPRAPSQPRASSDGASSAPLEAMEGNCGNHLPINAMALISSWQDSHPC